MRNLKRTLATSLALSMLVQLSAPALANSTNPVPDKDNSIISSGQEQEVRVLSSTIENSSVGIASGVTIDTSKFPTDGSEPNLTGATWTAVSGESGFDSLSGTQYLYLSDHVTLTDTLTLESGVTLHLCLNGHTLNGNSVGSVIRVEQGGTLYLYDSVEATTSDDKVESFWKWEEDDGVSSYTLTESTEGYDTLTGGIITGGTGKAGGTATNTNGGGISSSGSVYMYGGNIAGNTATKDGGGITATNPADNGSRVFQMYGGTIIGNKAGNNGGGVNTTTDVILHGGSILNNKTGDATVDANTNNGGGLNITGGGTVTMEAGFEISGNEAVENGGGIFVAAGFTHDSTPYDASTFTINGGTISGNSATSDGGGILNSGNLIFNDGEVSGNTARDGGGVYHISTSLDVEDIDVNVEDDVTEISGGSFTMTGGSILGNTAEINGGGVTSIGDFAMSGGTFDGNKAGANGGAVWTDGTFDLSGESSMISENTSELGGGVFIAGTGTFNMGEGTIKANEATEHGGGIYNNTGTVTLSGGSISNNTATKVSDGIYQGGTFTLDGTVNISGNDVYLLTAKVLTIGNDFDIETTSISLRVENPSDMSENSTAFTNGATADDVNKFTYSDFRNYEVVRADNSNELTLEKLGEWIDLNNEPNSAIITTEGYYYLSGDLELSNGLTIGNGSDEIEVTLDLEGHELSSNSGSVITVSSGCKLNLYDSNPDNVVNYGYWDNDEYKIDVTQPDSEPYDTLTGGIITGGSGSQASESDSVGGGAILNLGTLNMYGGTLAGNHVEGAGGAVRNNGTFTMSGGTVIGNSAQTQGGGVINIKDCAFHFSSGLIENNKALGTSEGKEGYGAGISNNGTLNMSGGSVIKNEAFSYAGGIANNYASGSGEFAFSGGLIAENNATTYGGGVNNAGTFTMSGGTIEKNSSGSNGGGVRNALTFTMSGGTISDNQATTTGGGVQNADTSNASADFNMSGGIISGNTAESKGDGIYQNGTFTLGTAIVQCDGIALVVEEVPDTTITIADNDVYLTYDSTSATSSLITIGDNFNVIGNIPVSMEKAGVFTDSTDLDHISLFTYGGDDGSYRIVFDEVTGTYALVESKLTADDITVSLNTGEGNGTKFYLTEDTSVTSSPDVSYNLSYTTDGEADVFFNKNGGTNDSQGMFGTWLPLVFEFDSIIPTDNLYVTTDNASASTGDCTWYKIDSTTPFYWELLQENIVAGKGHWYTFALLDGVTDDTVQKDTAEVADFVEVRITYDGTENTLVTLLGDNLLLGESSTLTFDEEWELYSSLSSQDVHDKYYGAISSVELTKEMEVNDDVDFADAGFTSFDLGNNTLTVESGVTITFPVGCEIYNGTTTEVDNVDDIKALFLDSGTDTVNVTGSKADGWVITGLMDLSGYTVTVDDTADLTYTGSALTPDVTVTVDETTLEKDKDYTVSYSNNTNVGTSATVTITGIGNYFGTTTANFEIEPKSLTSDMIAAITDQTHTGSPIEPTVTVKDGETPLVKDKDYTVSYTDNTNVGTSATVTITGIGNYTGTASTTFEIKEAPVTNATAPTFSTDLSTSEVKYTKGDSATTLSVTASASDSGTLSYQWYSTTTGVVNTSSDSKVGTDSASYNPSTTTEGTIYYYVVVTNTLNSTTATATSQVAKITVESATSPDVPVTSVTLNKSTLSLEEGKTETLIATVTPTNATNQAVTWSSVDTAVATVDSTGKVTAVGAGRTTITVTTTDGSKTASCMVTVTATETTPPADKTFTITFNPNGGTLSDSTLDTLSDGTLEYLYQPTRTGYTFDGWFTTSTGGTEITTSTVFEESSTIYAQWTKDTSGDSSGNNTGGTTTTTPNNSTSNSNSGYVSYSLTYPTIKSDSEGTASVSPSRIESGKTGTVTVTPKDGYVVDTITVIDAKNNSVTVREADDGTYQFTQPVSKVTVRISYVLESEKEETLPDGNTGTSPETSPEATPDTDATDPTTAFFDINDSTWCYPGVKFVLEQGYMSGTSSTTFSPDGDMTRAMLVTVLHSMEGKPTVTQSSKYIDVNSIDYYYQASLWATNKGIVSGTDVNLFSPNMSITREQVCLILYKYAMTQANIDTSQAVEAIYPDGADISPWAKEAVNWCASKSMLTFRADGNLQPQSQATRGEIATMLLQMYLFNS